MAIALREVFAIFETRWDGRALDRGDRQVEGVTDKLERLAGVLRGSLIAGAAAVFGKRLLAAASDAQETINVLGETLGANADAVVSWSRVTAEAVGRSEFQLQDYAARIAAIVTPTLGASEAARQLSTDFSQLAVDLSSFFNTTEEDALIALRAGLIGETEPLRRYGVNLLQVNLQEFARAEGIRKTIKQMSEAEKFMLRYRFIMQQTRNAQGDAARTTDQYANATRATSAALKDLSTRAGQALLPVAERVLRVVRDAVRGFARWAQESYILEAALAVVGAGLTALLVKTLAPFAGILAKFALWLAVLTAIALIVDDIAVAWQGGESAIGAFIDRSFGLGTTAQLIRDIEQALEGMNADSREAGGLMDELATALLGVSADWTRVLEHMREESASWIASIVGAWREAQKFVINVRRMFGGLSNEEANAEIRRINQQQSAAEEVASRQYSTERAFGAGRVISAAEHRQRARRERLANRRAIRRAREQGFVEFGPAFTPSRLVDPTTLRAPQLDPNAPGPVPVETLPFGRGRTREEAIRRNQAVQKQVNNNLSVSIDARGSSSPDDVKRKAMEGVLEMLDRRDRATHEALRQVGE